MTVSVPQDRNIETEELTLGHSATAWSGRSSRRTDFDDAALTLNAVDDDFLILVDRESIREDDDAHGGYGCRVCRYGGFGGYGYHRHHH